jgi:drug/metabolite transporter (DMT)-like permease
MYIVKIAVDPKTGFTPVAVVLLRLVIGGILMAMLLIIQCIRDRALFEKVKQNRQMKTILKMFVMGFFNNLVPFLLVGIAERSVNSGVASILDSSIPLFAMIFAHFALGGAERLTIMKLLGLGIGFAGVVLVCCEQVIDGARFSVTDFTGYVLVTLAAASYGLAAVFAKKCMPNLPGLYAATGQICSAALQTFVIFLFYDVGFESSHLRYFKTASLGAWLSIVYLGVCSTTVAYLCYFYLLRTVGSVKQSMVGYLLPVFGVAEGAILLKEWKGVPWYVIFIQIIGAVLVCGGIALVSLPSGKSTIDFMKRWSSLRKINKGSGDNAKSHSGLPKAYDYQENSLYYQTEVGQKRSVNILDGSVEEDDQFNGP